MQWNVLVSFVHIVYQVVEIKQLTPNGHHGSGPVKWNHCSRVVHRLLIGMGSPKLGPQAMSSPLKHILKMYFAYLIFFIVFHSAIKYILFNGMVELWLKMMHVQDRSFENCV